MDTENSNPGPCVLSANTLSHWTIYLDHILYEYYESILDGKIDSGSKMRKYISLDIQRYAKIDSPLSIVILHYIAF